MGWMSEGHRPSSKRVKLNQSVKCREGDEVMKQRMVVVAMMIALLLAFATVGAQDTPRIWAQADAERVTAGQTVTITVRLDGVRDIYGSSFKMLYDTALFEVVSQNGQAVLPGAFFGTANTFALKNSAGEGVVEYALTLTQPAQPVSGAGIVGTVMLRALAEAPVLVTLYETTLVSPLFIEVDGRRVAQSMNTIVPQVAAMTFNDVAPAAVASVRASAEQAAPRTISAPPAVSMPADQTMMLIAALFLIGGVALLIISVGMYTRMRSLNPLV
jgi:Cohesin domain.